MSFIANPAATCFDQTPNLGLPDCDFNWGAIKYHILAPLDTRLTATDVATPASASAKLQALATDNSYNLRIHRAPKHENVEDATTDATETELGNFGRMIVTDDGLHGLNAMVWDGGFEAYLRLRKFNSLVSSYGVFLVDENDNMMAWKTNDGEYAPLKMDKYHWRKFKFTAPKAVNPYMVAISFPKGEQLLSLSAAIRLEQGSMDELEQVNDIVLEDVSDSLAAGIFDIKATNYSVNIGNTIGSTAAVTTVFKAKKKSNNADLTITSVAMTTVGGEPAYKLTLSTADTDYDAGETAIIYWAPVQTIGAINDALKWFETRNPNRAFTSGQLEIVMT